MAKFDLKKAILENKATFFSSLTEGQFSWFTQDTNQQIGSQDENQIPVYMFDDKGKYYYENDYDGYGVFGGKDYYDLVAEMNGYTADNAEEFGGMFNDLRGIGIKLAFGELEPKNEGPILFPALVTRPNEFDYKTHDFTKEAKNDPNQSWYAAEEDDEDDDYRSDNDDDYDDSRDVDDDEYGDMAESVDKAKDILRNKLKSLSPLEYESFIEDYIEDVDDANEAENWINSLSNEEAVKYSSMLKEGYDEHIKALKKDMKDDKKSGKMKMSELKAKIKEMVLAEMESNNMEDAPENEVDFLAEIEGMLSEEDGETISKEEAKEYAESWEDDDILNDFNKTFNNQEKVTKPEFVNFFEDYIDDMSEIKYIQAAWRKLSSGEGLYEVKDKETDTEEVTDDVTDGEETVDVTDDFSMEEPQSPGGIDVTQNANADLTGTKKEVQDNLEAALEAARTLGDEKLATQVGNTITFFNKQHVVKDTPVAEGLNESMFPMLKKILK